jgi:hypothetical protein
MATGLLVVLQLQLRIWADDTAKDYTYSDVKYAYRLLKRNSVFHAYKMSYAQQWEFILWPSKFWHCTLKMEATGFYETLVTTYKSTPKRPQPKLCLKSIHKTRCLNIIYTPHTGNKIMRTAWIGCFILTQRSSLWFSQSTECEVLHLQYNFMSRKI